MLPKFSDKQKCLIAKLCPYLDDQKNELHIIPPNYSSVKKNLGPVSLTAPDYHLYSDLEKDSSFSGCGESAKEKVLNKIEESFRKIGLGGILVCNVRQAHLWNKIPDRKERLPYIRDQLHKYNRKYLKPESGCRREFESDFILFHPMLGIVTIDVKNAKTKSGKLFEQRKRAYRQMEWLSLQVDLLFYAIIGLRLPRCGIKGIPVQSVFCFPNADFELPSAKMPFFITKTVFDNGFEDFWTKKRERAEYTNLFRIIEFRAFIGAVAGYRGMVYIDRTQNALLIANRIQEQLPIPELRYEKKREQKFALEKLNGFIFLYPNHTQFFRKIICLTSEQHQAVCDDSRQMLIYGPPGTGKTLIILLKFERYALTKASKGRIVLVTRDNFMPIFQAFRQERIKDIEETRKCRELKGINIVFETSLKNIRYEDDIFIDEMETDEETDLFLKIRQKKAKGITVCAISGGNAVASEEFADFLANKFGKYTKHPLCSLMRGSKNIIEFWKKELPKRSGQFTVGHNWKCDEVTEFAYRSVNQAVLSVSEHIKKLPKILKRRYVAIITQTVQIRTDIENHLTNQEIKWLPSFNQAENKRHSVALPMPPSKPKKKGECRSEKEKRKHEIRKQKKKTKKERKKENKAKRAQKAADNVSVAADSAKKFAGKSSQQQKQEQKVARNETIKENILTIDDCVIVDDYTRVLSKEWPYVIVVTDYCSTKDESFMLIAASRAIVNLTIIRYDYVEIQKLLNKKFETCEIKPDLTNNIWIGKAHTSAIEAVMERQILEGIELPIFSTTSEVTEETKIKEEEKIVNFHRHLTILRNNFIHEDLGKSVHFPGSNTFTECVQQIEISCIATIEEFLIKIGFESRFIDCFIERHCASDREMKAKVKVSLRMSSLRKITNSSEMRYPLTINSKFLASIFDEPEHGQKLLDSWKNITTKIQKKIIESGREKRAKRKPEIDKTEGKKEDRRNTEKQVAEDPEKNKKEASSAKEAQHRETETKKRKYEMASGSNATEPAEKKMKDQKEEISKQESAWDRVVSETVYDALAALMLKRL